MMMEVRVRDEEMHYVNEGPHKDKNTRCVCVSVCLFFHE